MLRNVFGKVWLNLLYSLRSMPFRAQGQHPTIGARICFGCLRVVYTLISMLYLPHETPNGTTHVGIYKMQSAYDAGGAPNTTMRLFVRTPRVAKQAHGVWAHALDNFEEFARQVLATTSVCVWV
jgi:hypothetical protein